jgi:hypothetical protein
MPNAFKAREPRKSRRRTLWRDETGGTAVELGVVLTMLLLSTFGIIEFGILLAQYNAGEKATQIGVRRAVTSSFVAPGLASFDGTGGTSPPPTGTPCMDAGGNTISACNFTPVTCVSAGCSGAFGFSATAFNAIVTDMRRVDPWITAQNVQIQYAPNGLGFVGRPGGLPVTVTVALINLSYSYVVIGALAGLGASRTLPPFTATLTGEDLNG